MKVLSHVLPASSTMISKQHVRNGIQFFSYFESLKIKKKVDYKYVFYGNNCTLKDNTLD